jgi:hypothetical protein
MGENAGGGGAVVNIDLTEISQKLDEIAKVLAGDPKKLVKEIAIKLYANSEFDKSGKSAVQLADAAIERAKILVTKLG